MSFPDTKLQIYRNGLSAPIGPADAGQWTYLESLIRADYERCHPGEALEDIKRRARFSKEDKGLLCDWMAVAAQRALKRRDRETDLPRVAA